LAAGPDLRRQGNQGRTFGFLMAIFQKIAASLCRRTLKRRLLMLTLCCCARERGKLCVNRYKFLLPLGRAKPLG